MLSSKLQATAKKLQHVSVFRNKTTLAIRRETINVWERRAPLAPAHVKQVIESGVNVLVQPSARRSFYMQVCVTTKLF